MHKQAELVPQILKQHAEGREWTVSMEQEYCVNNSGFLVAHETHENHEKGESEELEEWAGQTPEDLRELGWVYVPASSRRGSGQRHSTVSASRDFRDPGFRWSGYRRADGSPVPVVLPDP